MTRAPFSMACRIVGGSPRCGSRRQPVLPSRGTLKSTRRKQLPAGQGQIADGSARAARILNQPIECPGAQIGSRASSCFSLIAPALPAAAAEATARRSGGRRRGRGGERRQGGDRDPGTRRKRNGCRGCGRLRARGDLAGSRQHRRRRVLDLAGRAGTRSRRRFPRGGPARRAPGPLHQAGSGRESCLPPRRARSRRECPVRSRACRSPIAAAAASRGRTSSTRPSGLPATAS